MSRSPVAASLAPHHRLLVEAVLAPPDELARRYQLWAQGFDPDAPVDAGTYRLLPLLWTRVRDLPDAAPLERRLRGIYRHSWVAQQQLWRELVPGVAVVASAGVPLMVLKGAALVLEEYAEAGSRPMQDIDVLVRPADRHLARQALEDAGWATPRAGGTERPDVFGQVNYQRRSGGPELDLHWRAPGDLPAGEWIWADARPASLDGVPVVLPSPTAHLAVTLAHGVRGNRESPIRWVVDAARLLDHHGESIDWDRLVALAELARLRTRFAAGLRLLIDLGVADPPPEHWARLSRDTWLERWEYDVRDRGVDAVPYATFGLARYWSSKRELPLSRAALGLAPHLLSWSRVRVRRAVRAGRGRGRRRPAVSGR